MKTKQFRLMIESFEQAEVCIDNGYLDLARQLITELPESIYEKALSRYKSKIADYYFYLIRFVLDRIELESVYTQKAGMKNDVYASGMMVEILRSSAATSVFEDRQLVVTKAGLDTLLSKPYQPIKKIRRKAIHLLPTPLFQARV